MSAQLQEFTVKAETFKCQGRCGPRSCKGSHCLTSLNIHKPKSLLGVQGRHLHSMEMKAYFLTQTTATSSGFSWRKVMEKLCSCFSCIFQSKIENAEGLQEHIFTIKLGGGGTRGPFLNTHFGNVHEGNKLLEMWSHRVSEENQKNKAGGR